MKIILLMLLALNIENACSMQTIYTNEKVALSKHDEAILRKIAKKINVPFESISSNPYKSDYFIVNEKWLITRDENKNKKIDPGEYLDGRKNSPNLFSYNGYGAGYMVNKQGRIWSLSFDRSSFDDIDLLHKFPDLIAFSCVKCKFDKIEMKKLTNLRYIDLSLTKVLEIGDLSGGINISFLTMEYEGDNLSGIEKLNNLQWLTLWSKKLNSLKPLETLNKLLKLEINISNDAGHYTDIDGMPKNLEALVMRDPDNITSVDVIGNLGRLKYISVSWLNNKNLNLFKSLTNLETMELAAFKQLESLEGIEGLAKLKKLDVSSTKITSMKPLSNLSKLEDLRIFGSNIKLIEGLENKQHLKIIDIGKSPIEKIQGLEGAPKLQMLDLVLTNVTKVEGFDNNRCLEELNLSGNKISKFENLTHLPILSKLYIQKTGIKEFPGWQDMKRLRVVSMDKKGFGYGYVPNADFNDQLRRNPNINDEERKQYGCL